MQIINQRTATVPIASIAADPANPNQGDIGAISESIQSSGFFGHVLVQESTGRIIAGAHRHAAARALGAAEIPVTFVDVDDERARRIMLADNRTQRLGSDDPDRLAALLQELAATPASLAGTGYDGDALDELLADLGQLQPELAGDPDAVPEVPAEPVSQRGDLWVLGEHRLLCGDCTDVDALGRLLGGEHAAITLTSPPYNMAKDSGLPNHEKYLVPDEREDGAWLDLLVRFTQLALERSEYVFVNIQSVAGNKMALIDYLGRCRASYADTLIWDKITAEPAMNKRCLNSRFEYVHIFSQAATRAIGTALFHGTLDNVLALSSHTDKEHANVHKATFPVSFADHFVRNFCQEGEAVFDPFLGTGTTLISCEGNGRRCFGVEVVPAYCDVIVQRWQDLTGKTAVREQVADDARVLTGT